ncbi:type II secretion system protein GspD [Spirochaeta dissipatitropha]
MNSNRLTAVLVLWLCLKFISINPVHSMDQVMDSDIRIQSMSFQNQPLRDILYMFSQVGGISILSDESVYGYASYSFTEAPFTSALKAFLLSNELYYRVHEGIVFISAIHCSISESGNINLSARDVAVKLVFESLSRTSEIPITYTGNPDIAVNIHAVDLPLAVLIEIISQQLPETAVHKLKSHYLITSVHVIPDSNPGITYENGKFSIQIQQASAKKSLLQLFELAGYEYSFMTRRDETVIDINIQNRSFADALEILSREAGYLYIERDQTIYIFDTHTREHQNIFVDHVIYQPEHLSSQHLITLIPHSLSANVQIRNDSEQNRLVISGLPASVISVIDIIKKLDTTEDTFPLRKIQLEHVPVEAVIANFPEDLLVYRPRKLSFLDNIILFSADDSGFRRVKDYVDLIDRGSEPAYIELQYIHAEDILSNLPTRFRHTEINMTAHETIITVNAPEHELESFLTYLEQVDVPKTQIKYQMLIIQYQHGQSQRSEGESNIGYDLLNLKAGLPQVVAVLGSLLNLNFDVITHFGISFAAKLSASLQDNSAEIFADTTLHGVSGESIHFRNTDTFRYIDREPGDDKTISYSGVTREITSGLLIDLNGRHSGNGMITIDIQATVSKRGTDTRHGDPPPTSERIVRSRVQTPIGQPIIISGLIQRDIISHETRIPVISRIPIIGRLFRKNLDSLEETEMAIYIVPYIENLKQDQSFDQDMQRKLFELLPMASGIEYGSN